MRLLSSEIAQATGGKLVGPEVEVSGASCDSRILRPGQLFVPIKAQRDGHKFIVDAVAGGALAYLTTSSKVKGATAIVVKDTLKAFADVARLARSRLADHVLGITGSVGKTSVKDLIAPILAEAGPVTVSAKSFNNEIGVPLTLINAGSESLSIVVEMGATKIGDIANLCSIAKPTVGVVTNVALAHVGSFGGVENIAISMGELYESLPAHGVAVVNVMDDTVFNMRTRTEARVLTFGINSGDVRASNVVVDDMLRPSFRLTTPHGAVNIHMQIHGQHQVINAVAAAASAMALGVGMADIVTGLESARLSQWRMELLKTNTGAILLNDVYNANPTSVSAALQALAHLNVTGRRIAVLGQMAELGDISEEQHEAIGELARTLEIELISYQSPAYGTKNFEKISDIVTLISDTSKSDAILVKGSRVASLEILIDHLI